MTSYIFNSKSEKLTHYKLIKLYALTVTLVGSGFLIAEMAVRHYFDREDTYTETVSELIARLPTSTISDREVGNQLLAQNVALFSTYPTPNDVKVGYVGTSRTKILQPSHLGLEGRVVGAGNTYNEISYGLILQAEILRLRFPNLKTLYVETSLLLRRPGRFMVEPDHLKYLPLLLSLKPLCSEQKKILGCTAVFAGAQTRLQQNKVSWHLAIHQYRNHLRFSSLLADSAKEIQAQNDPLLKTLTSKGERNDRFPPITPTAKLLPEISNDHIKVQRLRDIPSNAPWDGLFDMFAEWGKDHAIQIVFYQPPVRSDLYNFQKQYGLEEHVRDLKRTSSKYEVPFIDLDKPEVGLMQDWSLFNDEDHLGTCKGSTLMMLALEQGIADFKNSKVLAPEIQRTLLDQKLEASGACVDNQIFK
ncbi:hypothetical protein N8H41_18230 [Pseudomonas vlassakiae]|uniref:hypothetical protein n=1 Tax=Pseudomonas vlassakiae TaxID=485888 RepID=UPI0021C8BF7F|nr:hypothetical protein [Pseudomonas vlassakiae]MCU0125915.1 hypothetical protein [Pseudomonas vlassakiae]